MKKIDRIQNPKADLESELATLRAMLPGMTEQQKWQFQKLENKVKKKLRKL